MGFLGLPEYRPLLDAWNADKDRGDLVIGKEGSAKLDVDLASPSPHTRTPEPDDVDPSSNPGVLGTILGGLTGGKHREPEAEAEA